MAGSPSKRPLVVAAHRLPVTRDGATGKWSTSPGGLVAALAPVLRERGGVWVGWDGGAGGREKTFEVEGITNRSVALSTDEIENHYDGFCNGTIWPLYHDAIRPLEFHRHWWRPHQQVSERFADAVAGVADRNSRVWVHDYQLQLVPSMLRQRLPRARIGFFLHIPVPPDRHLRAPPLAVPGLGGASRRRLSGVPDQAGGAQLRRRGAWRSPGPGVPHPRSSTGAGPCAARRSRSRSTSSAACTVPPRLQPTPRQPGSARTSGNPDHVILGVDRLDYTKGIDLRLRAFEVMLDRHPELLGRVSMVQVAVPSREDVGEYQTIRRRVEEMVGRINGRFGRAAWVPVHYLYRSLGFEELVGAYLSADVMLITPLRDGMNLVALEYVVTRLDNTGVLILSEFAGAAERLKDALIVNPYDLDALALSLHQAITMNEMEQGKRMSRLRRVVRHWDVHAWARHNLEEIGA